MIIKSAQFLTSAVKQDQYPNLTYPEVAFVGRSNVGKSSLINALLNRKRLVKTSSTPGRTQLINFFVVNDMILLIDFPGYGYAKVPLKVRKTWGPMIEAYFQNRKELKATVLIMDVRRTPNLEDINIINWLESNQLPIICVLTKIDKLSKNKLLNQVKIIENELQLNKSNLILFSAKTKVGCKNIWAAIQYLLFKT